MGASEGTDSDRISNLPGNVSDSILAFLLIREAIRTSILSTKWKDTWATLPHLVFTENTFEGALLDSRGQRHLKLSNCVVRPPHTFSGFRKLTRIVFRRVLCSATSLKTFIANSPLLKELLLLHMLDLRYLDINAPNLKCLWLTGEFKSICFITTPRIKLWSLCISGCSEFSAHLVNLLCCLSGTIKQLYLNSYILQFLAVENIPENLPSPFIVLWKISLSKFLFEDLNAVAFALYLIENSPNLVELRVHIKKSKSPSVHVEPVLTFLKAKLKSIKQLKKLNSFKITSVCGTKSEMELIKFILASSPELRNVMIKPNTAHPSYNGYKVLKELTSFSHASSKAQIVYLGQE